MSKLVALDAGHGLNTPGKRTPDGIHEWELNDKVRDKVVTYLSEYDVDFIFPDNNEGNVDEGLTTRRNMYVNAKVDAAVSIHHNAFTGNWNNATGVEVYVDRNGTSRDRALAAAIYNRLVANTGLRGRGIKEENWTVIKQNSVPAVLTEGGFMDSHNDYKVITSDAGQTAYARAVADGLIEFLGLVKRTNGTPVIMTDGVLYCVQTGAFTKEEYAKKLSAELKSKGFDTYIVQSGGYHKVQVGAYSVKDNAVNTQKKLQAAGYDTLIATKNGKDSAPAQTTTPTPAPTPIVEKKKTAMEVAKEIVAGKGNWGNGDTRKQRVTAYGLDYAEVQAIVNQLLKNGTTVTSNKKSNEEIAREVIAGKWGVGAARKRALTQAGYDYNAIQKIVNKLVK